MPRQIVPTQFKILIKDREDGKWIAHCLELDIVTVAPTFEEARIDILELIEAQIRYAAENDNWDYLYRDAPKEVWDEYLGCPDQPRRETLTISLRDEGDEASPAPIQFNVCALRHCHV